MKDQVDALEQHSQRNCVRIGPIPESAEENMDDIVKAVAKSVGVNLTNEAIDCSHLKRKVSDGILRQACPGEIDDIPTKRGSDEGKKGTEPA